MTQSITFYLRRKKYIYCTININGLTSSRSTGISVYDPKTWTGRYIVDNRKKKAAQEVNERISDFEKKIEQAIERSAQVRPTPDDIFDQLDGKVEKYSVDVPVTLSQALEYYVSMNNKLKGYSKHTLRTYQRIIDYIVPEFLKYLDVKDLYLNSFKSRTAKEFKAFMNAKQLGQSSQDTYLVVLKSAFKVMMEDFPADEYPEVGIITNPFNVRSIKVKERNNFNENYIPPDREKILWDLMRSGYKPNGYDIYEDYVILALLLWNTGMSFAETCSPYIVTKDFLSQEDIFKYTRSKTRTEARVLFYPELREILDIVKSKEGYYREKYNNWLPVQYYYDKDMKLDLTLYQEQYNKFYQFLRSHLSKELGKDKEVSPHTFRHSFAVKMIDKGHSLDVVKTMMGHSSITTTEKHYAYIVDSRLISEKRQNDSKNKKTGS